MLFKEFTNPEERDYDITSSLGSTDSSLDNNNSSSINSYSEQLCDLIGILEDATEEELQAQYGICMNEYLHPTQETIDKVFEKIKGRHK